MLGQLADSGAWVDFTQGIDIRLMTDEKAAAINKVKYIRLHFAWDNFADTVSLEKLKEYKTAFKGMKQYCRYCSNCMDAGDIYYCDAKAIPNTSINAILPIEKLKRVNKCKDFCFCAVDVLDPIGNRRYKPRRPSVLKRKMLEETLFK